MQDSPNEECINKVISVINQAAEGDFTVRLDADNESPDFNRLAIAINNLITKTRETLLNELSSAKALDKSEAKYHRLHDSMMDAFACTDMEGRIIESNPSYQAMVGYTAEELRQIDYFELTPEKWHEFERTTATEQLLSRGYSEVYEKEYRRKDGTIFPVEIRVFLLRSEDGQPEAMWGIVRDITERKQLEKARRLYDFTLSNSPDAVYWIHRDASFAFVNEQACQSLGYTQKELQNLKLWDIDPVFSKEEWESSWASKPPSGIGAVERLESIHRRKDGSEFPVEITSRQIILDDVEYDVAFARDISQRKEAEKALELTQFCLDNASVAYVRATEDGKLVDANKQACKSLGYSKPELLTKYVYDVDATHSKEFWDAFVKELGENEYCKFESAHQRKDQSTFPIEITSTMLKYDGEKIIVGFVTDIRERKQAEDAIRESEYHLRKSQEIAQIGSYRFNITQDSWTASEELNRIFGIGPDYQKTKDGWLRLIHPDDQPILDQYLADIIQNKLLFDKEYRIIRPTDRNERWVHG